MARFKQGGYKNIYRTQKRVPEREYGASMAVLSFCGTIQNEVRKISITIK